MTVMEGSLSKWTNVMKGWQYRWFVLDETSGLLTYYTSKEKMMRGARRGCVRLKGAIIGIDDEDDSTFTITVDHKTFHFQARDAEERERWVRALEDTIFRHCHRMMWDTHRPPPTIKDFDNKVAEADAYLQLMIEQTKKLEEKMNEFESDTVEYLQCQLILEHANTMLDNIKHSIVLLQIAKNTAHPINGVYQQKTNQLMIDTEKSTYSGYTDSDNVLVEPIIRQGIELGAECIENTRRCSLGGNNGNTVTPNLSVPPLSYSSSEGEDDFFDANDSPFTPASLVTTPTSLRSFDTETTMTVTTVVPTITNTTTIANTKSTDITTKITRSTDVDYDALYEESDENDVEMDSQGSVIRHLLSQVKIGMDLTKVVLPTFILERRSLLEMYADYFAHPDIFLKIADLNNSKDRMIQVVKWYLSSYHAGRKSAVAKKPYNPILGEIFRCYWNSNDQQHVDYDDKNDKDVNVDDDNNVGMIVDDMDMLVTDGPIPWCKKNDLVFVAEQVSHHPPISAFYAEHYNKRITFNAHVYTKSKFLGLSVCVHNIGQGIVSILDYNEDYLITFPNGYGRSILTVPWIELGGNVTITCPQSGFMTNIEFLTKPFYGNKKNRIVADLYGPDDKKPFLTINGEWNGIMESKTNEKDNELFIDVNALEIVKKQVKPINEQDDNESRRLWKDVTAGLKFNDIDRATSAKQYLEQKQRDEAKLRKDMGLEWDTKLFTKTNNDGWIYTKPLKQRLQSSSTTTSSSK